MQKLSVLFFLTIFGSFLLLESACTTDKLPEPEPPAFCDTTRVTYNLQIKEIIDTNCAIPTCHRSGTAAPGNYTSYSSMEPFLTETVFKRFVVDLRNDPDLGMPPNWDHNPGPKDLTDQEFDLVTCWIDAGYPEN